MDIASWCRQSRILVVAGKGGVGKTTITAALARMASDAGLDVLAIDLEGTLGVPAAFGRTTPLDYGEVVLAEPGAGRGAVRARRITPDDALLEYLADHGMKRVSRRLVSSGTLDVVATAIPGIRDILVLGRVKQLERSRAADLLLVDAPATGHAMTFLSSARSLLDAARSGPVRAQAQEVADLLADSSRCQVILVTLAEEMPVNETVESAFRLEDDLGVGLAPVVVNACLADVPGLEVDPEVAADDVGARLAPGVATALGGAARFHRGRLALQEQQLERLAEELPLPQLRAPLLFGDAVGVTELDRLAASLAEGIEALPTPSADADRGRRGRRTGRARPGSPGGDGGPAGAPESDGEPAGAPDGDADPTTAHGASDGRTAPPEPGQRASGAGAAEATGSDS
jgi:anion-transporting  ArsA/GET3 family ATPase